MHVPVLVLISPVIHSFPHFIMVCSFSTLYLEGSQGASLHCVWQVMDTIILWMMHGDIDDMKSCSSCLWDPCMAPLHPILCVRDLIIQPLARILISAIKMKKHAKRR